MASEKMLVQERLLQITDLSVSFNYAARAMYLYRSADRLNVEYIFQQYLFDLMFGGNYKKIIGIASRYFYDCFFQDVFQFFLIHGFYQKIERFNIIRFIDVFSRGRNENNNTSASVCAHLFGEFHTA